MDPTISASHVFYHITLEMTLSAIFVFVIHLVFLLTLSPVMWYQEQFWIVGLLQTEKLANLEVAVQKCS
jgi:hypothetical protein